MKMGSRELEGPPETLDALQSTGANPTLQHLLHRFPPPPPGVCGEQVWASKGASIPAIWGDVSSIFNGKKQNAEAAFFIHLLFFVSSISAFSIFLFFCYLPFTNVWQKLFFQEENLKACHEPLDPEGAQMGFSGKQNLS